MVIAQVLVVVCDILFMANNRRRIMKWLIKDFLMKYIILPIKNHIISYN